MSSTLWIVATPLGNPSDLSQRAQKILKEADIVLSEDTRKAKRLFIECELPMRKFYSFFEHNEEEREKEILASLAEGKSVALITDAGTPLIADPGYKLVCACRKNGIAVSPVPGPSAIMAGLSAAGIAPIPFSFLGFPPRAKKDKQKLFETFASMPGSLVFFERKDRLEETLEEAFLALGDREFVICREMTKFYEEFIEGNLKNHKECCRNLLGELTIIIGPPTTIAKTDLAEVQKILANEKNKGLKNRQAAISAKPKCSGWTTSELYALLCNQD